MHYPARGAETISDPIGVVQIVADAGWIKAKQAPPLDISIHAPDVRSMKPPSQRQLRAGELVRHALMEIFARDELEDPALAGVSITVTEVRMSPDLRHGTVFCAPLGGADMARVIATLNRASGFLRGRLGRAIDLRFTPSLKFIADETFDEAARIGALLNTPRVRKDLERDDRDPEDGED